MRMITEPAVAIHESVTVDDFDEIFTRFWSPVLGYVFHLIGEKEFAEDLTQTAFLNAWKALAAGQTKSDWQGLRAWLYTIAHNVARDALRRRKIIQWQSLSLYNLDDSHEDQSDERKVLPERDMAAFISEGGRFERLQADRELAQIILRRLSSDQVRILLLDYEDCSSEEIAALLRTNAVAARMRLMRARQRARELYRREMGR